MARGHSQPSHWLSPGPHVRPPSVLCAPPILNATFRFSTNPFLRCYYLYSHTCRISHVSSSSSLYTSTVFPLLIVRPHSPCPRHAQNRENEIVILIFHTEKERDFWFLEGKEMEGRGGCCIARYAASGVYDMSNVDRIMLRFRPIAPKPATGGSVTPQENSDLYSKSGRGKRRHSKDNNVNNTKQCNRRRRVSSEEKRVTLPLLPEAPDCKGAILKEERREVVENIVPVWLNFGQADEQRKGSSSGGVSADRSVVMAAAPPAMRVVTSCVTVECVTDTWVSGDGLGRTDEERRVNLGKDTCPGFISDGLGRVTWTNGAYKEMVGGEMTVWLVMKERLPMITYQAFTCRVRVQQYTCGKERSSLTLPCDVWRMDGGGFAWRLDIDAALCLGR